MDVTDESPPANLNLLVGELPILVLLPAVGGELSKPLPIFYSGVGKVQAMMKWVQKFASIPFELPNLPHLNEEQVKMYKTQVREREEALEKKRAQEAKDLEEEEKGRLAALERAKKQQQPQQQQDRSPDDSGSDRDRSGKDSNILSPEELELYSDDLDAEL
jgi:hypothetical protein